MQQQSFDALQRPTRRKSSIYKYARWGVRPTGKPIKLTKNRAGADAARLAGDTHRALSPRTFPTQGTATKETFSSAKPLCVVRNAVEKSERASVTYVVASSAIRALKRLKCRECFVAGRSPREKLRLFRAHDTGAPVLIKKS
jgi:hypothetical protein